MIHPKSPYDFRLASKCLNHRRDIIALKPPYNLILAYNLLVRGQRSEDVDQEGVMSMDDQPHEMQLIATHASGAEEWFCPRCGRRFLMQWPPEYKKIVLEPGDECVIHGGAKGGLRMGLAEFSHDDPTLLEGLRPWVRGLKDINLDLDEAA
jgi:hypothetical protein